MKLPRISGIELIKRLKKVGFVATRQKGSHVRLEKQEGETITKLTVPIHKELKTGTLRQILKDSGITPEAFDKMK